jgi:zinc transporter ZupT
MQHAPESAYAVLEGFAAGAMLTVVAETMLPEAYHKGGGIVGLSTLTGFLSAVLLSAVG